MPSLQDLEEIRGSAQVGVATDIPVQTPGGDQNLIIDRQYKVLAVNKSNYIFDILDPVTAITDPSYPSAYLVKQSFSKLDDVNAILHCRFAMVPVSWITDYDSQSVTFPGILPSSLYAPNEFDFRSAASSIDTMVRRQHDYFYGNPTGIPVYDRFRPVDQFGNQVSVITDYTDPSADQYIAMVQGRQEITVKSIVKPWMGWIFERLTLYAIAQ